MSVSGISGSSFFQAYNPGSVQNKFQQFQQEFQNWGRICNRESFASAKRFCDIATEFAFGFVLSSLELQSPRAGLQPA